MNSSTGFATDAPRATETAAPIDDVTLTFEDEIASPVWPKVILVMSGFAVGLVVMAIGVMLFRPSTPPGRNDHVSDSLYSVEDSKDGDETSTAAGAPVTAAAEPAKLLADGTPKPTIPVAPEVDAAEAQRIRKAEQERRLQERARARALHRELSEEMDAPKPARRAEAVADRAEASTRRASSAASNAPVPARPARAAGQASLDFWNAMNAEIEKEESRRTPPSGGVTATNAGDFLARRIDAGELAAAALRALPTDDVDADLPPFAEKLAAWYAKGAEISTTGKNLLEKADDKTRKGTQGKSWQNADKSHQQSVGALNGEGELLRRKLQQKYQLKFPALK